MFLVTMSAAWLPTGAVLAAESEINIEKPSKLAIHGYDPVAYFKDGSSAKGSADFTATYKGADWHFASAANRDAFQADPERYAPQYGGHCAYAASKGYFADADPDAWTLHDGKLYLNYSTSVRTLWSEQLEANIASGDKNWPEMLKKQ
jgi:YHS domain-containing protein